jgi:hypothetical protein
MLGIVARMTAANPTTVASNAATTAPKKPPKLDANPYPWYSPRFWHGMRPGAFWAMCARHRFRIHPIRWPMVLLIGLITPFNSVMGVLQWMWYGKLIDDAQLKEPPVFIIGHWRSGTTFLHELMYLDDRFVSPTTYQCFAPHHFLLTEWFIARYLAFLLPKQRPMDNMAAGFDRPQEDEFALLTLGAPTPYVRIAFPNDPPPYSEFLDMHGCSPEDQARFERAMNHFVKLLTVAADKRVLLKSPPHTGRVEVLSKLFPGAKFIHIVRNPYSLFPSTIRLWQSLDEVQGMQLPKGVGLEEYVFDCLTRMYRGYEQQREKLDPAAVVDLRYEDLVADPVGEVAKLYERLNLGDFGPVRDKVAAFVGEQKDYKPNKHQMDETLKAKIRERWAGYFERYGY